jgi:two-component system response regulator VicR
MGKKVLIVEDERAIVDILTFNLTKENYEVIVAMDGGTGLGRAEMEKPDLILLDVMLPVMDGFEVCKKVREKSEVPIIMLTAREEEVDKVMGLELGADDYITKPFSMRELLARIKANMRRFVTKEITTDEKNVKISDAVIHAEDLTIDTERYEVKKAGHVIDLTLREYELLKFLATQNDKIFSREQLLEKVWGYEYYGDVRTVDVAVRRLREKIEEDPAQPSYIQTKRGVGYYFSNG